MSDTNSDAEMELSPSRDIQENNEVLDEDPPLSAKVRKVLTLKKNCLDCVTKNFEIYNTAFLTSKDTTLHRNLQFLQRRYSLRIIVELAEEDVLDDRHLDFLINEHLEELDIEVFLRSGCTLQVIKSRMAEVGHGFTRVSFDVQSHIWEQNITEFVNEVICYLPNVEILDVRRHCNDTTLKNISKTCRKLCELHLDDNVDVTNEGIKMLCKGDEGQAVKTLKVLSLNNTHVTTPGIIYLLENIHSLEAIDYNNFPYILYSMHKDNLENNTLSTVKKYNLNKLDLVLEKDGDYIPHAKVLQIWTELCPNVSHLCLRVDSEECLDLIPRFSKLEHLTLKSGDSLNMNLNNILKSNGAKLKSFDVDSFNTSVDVLITSCPKLENLTLMNVHFRAFEDIKKICLNNLTELLLQDIKFHDHYTEDSVNCILQSSPMLEKLTMKHCRFENSEMNTKLAKYCESNHIQHLRFNHCDIKSPLLESIILTCSSLKTLIIDNCENIGPNDAVNMEQLNFTRSYVEIHVFDDDSDIDSTYSNGYDYYDEYDPDSDGYDQDYDGYDVDGYDIDDYFDDDDHPYLDYEF